MFIIILLPILMVLDFFGVNITDDYVKDNMKYAEKYKSTLNSYLIKNKGYVPLVRILYFYSSDKSLSFDEIYEDNLDNDTKKLKTIQEVCKLKKYSKLSVCNKENINKSNQIKEEQSKPFSYPINFTSSTVTSFFMEEREVFDTYDVHEAWDFAASSKTPVYSVCDGFASIVSFTYSENTTDTSGGLGNYIEIKCNIGTQKYSIVYGHLYPNSNTIKTGSTVRKGQKIGEVGTTGYSTGNHLHFKVSIKDKPVDGMSLINFK